MRWREAMTGALYGPEGFFTRTGAAGPIGHFRTSAHTPLFARAVARLLVRLDRALGRPDRLDVVDVGAGRGELLTALLRAVPPELAARLRPVAVELAGRPAGLPEAVGWAAEPPETVTGLLIATEWLDNVPLEIAVSSGPESGGNGHGGEEPDGARPDGWRYLLVERDGTERLGPSVTPPDAGWLERWWPAAGAGTRAEIGAPRDEAWGDAVARVARGLALAVDYGHLRGARPPFGTLTGYREGRAVPPVPDGSCDLTAHVALDAVAAAGERTAGAAAVLVDQRRALRALGVDAARPPLAMASADPAGYLRRLAEAGEAAELVDPNGLGGHHWLLQPAGPDAGAVARALTEGDASGTVSIDEDNV